MQLTMLVMSAWGSMALSLAVSMNEACIAHWSTPPFELATLLAGSPALKICANVCRCA